MILILSDETDESTHYVIDWLYGLTSDYFRLNGDSLLEYDITVKFNKTTNRLGFSLVQNHRREKEIKSDNCKVIWFRRWAIPKNFIQSNHTSSIKYQITRYTHIQFNSLFEVLCKSLAHSKWVNDPSEPKLSKLYVLEKAIEAGLMVPETLICTNKAELERFQKLNERIITKSIGDVTFFYEKSDMYALYTSELTFEEIKVIDETFFPSLVQKRIEKEYEIRIFYLDSMFYSMAMFSQNHDATMTDFRQDTNSGTIRAVPYLLPKPIENKLEKLMRSLDMKSGSIDMIKNLSGDYIFLEVNPVGQFGMVSLPCNYFLEKKISEYLFKMYKDNEE